MSHAQQGSEETVRVVSGGTVSKSEWTPVIGPVFTELIDRQKLNPEERAELREKSVSILGRCLPPQPPDGTAFTENITGLAVGYVQSGKTMSFTCVSALAADNAFPLVIIITGTTAPLYRQTIERLREELSHDGSRGIPWRWQIFENPSATQNDESAFNDLVRRWNDHKLPSEDKQTALILVMKHHQRLFNLSQLLERIPLTGIPAIVIDDEADQASLNNLVKRENQSRTYQRILELKACLPRHTYLQYTATPQAPLLINIIDALSPKFASVLEPGSNYVDLEQFFNGTHDHVEIIPSEDIPSEENILDGAPPSLLHAMRVFFVGVAIEINRKGTGVRSMLVHPSKLTEKHAHYNDWIKATIAHWLDILKLGDSDPDKTALIDDFRSAHSDLASTEQAMLGFDELVPELYRALMAVSVLQVNARSGKTPPVDWTRARAHILVGGTAMDRGFTVKGLTVTYMPRGPGVGNADTIQQRARFLGYKASYFGLCRVYVETNVFQAYTNYVLHESDIRKRLAEFDQEKKPLQDWKRAFFLDSNLKPTRQSVLDLEYKQGAFRDKWFYPRAPHIIRKVVDENRLVVRDFLTHLTFVKDSQHSGDTEISQHGVCSSVPLGSVFKDLLVLLKHPHPEDSQDFTGALLQIKDYLDHNPDADCAIFQMSWNADSGQLTRKRSVDAQHDGIIYTPGAFFMGPSVGRGGESHGTRYLGDTAVCDKDRLTLQVHRLRVVDSDANDAVLGDDVLAVALWIPACMERDTLVQKPPA